MQLEVEIGEVETEVCPLCGVIDAAEEPTDQDRHRMDKIDLVNPGPPLKMVTL